MAAIIKEILKIIALMEKVIILLIVRVNSLLKGVYQWKNGR